MTKLSEVDKSIIDKVIASVDWEQIVKFYKILNRKIGYEQIRINGVSRKAKITEDDAKDELRKVLEYVIENDIPEMAYGSWIISWINGEWEITETIMTEEEGEPQDIHIPIIESKLQVNFVPQSITVREEIEDVEISFELEENGSPSLNFKETLSQKLEESVASEDYPLAAKIRDLLEELNKKKK